MNFGENHSYVASHFYTIGLLNKKKGLYDQAEQYLQKSVTIYKKTLPADHRKTADALFEVGDTFQLQTKHQEAISPLREAFSIRSKKTR